MVADGIGVKLYSLIIVLKTFLMVLEAIYQRIASTYGKVEAIEICSKKALFYSHSIVADGFGDMS